MQPFRNVLQGTPIRHPLCNYYSPDKELLLHEIKVAYRSCRSGGLTHPGTSLADPQHIHPLLALVVPHGAACDGFFVAASAYTRLNAFLLQRGCRHLTAVLLGTEHRGTTPVALSRQDWQMPLGTAHVGTAAVDYLSQQHHLPINEAPHNSEHAIENQLPFLLHGASCGWDLAAAGCSNGVQPGTLTPAAAATLSIVPVSIGYLGNQLPMIQSVGAAVRDVMQHLKQQQFNCKLQAGSSGGGGGTGGSSGGSGDGSGGSGDGSEVVLIVTSDFTHAGPSYRELPPAGVSLEEYMRKQDTPVLQAVQQGSVDALLSAAAATHNSMCGLYPLAVALEALYGRSSSSGSRGSSSSSAGMAAAKPELLDYRAAHTIFERPDSTGFAAFAVHAL